MRQYPQHFRPVRIVSINGKLFEKLILRTIQKRTEERNLLNASQFGFQADHSTTLQCMRLVDHAPQISAIICRWLPCSYINDASMAPGAHLALFADDTYIYMTGKHECHVLWKLQCRVTAVNSWCERWNVKSSEGKTQAIYFSKSPWWCTTRE
jgi:hypothetical protein